MSWRVVLMNVERYTLEWLSPSRNAQLPPIRSVCSNTLGTWPSSSMHLAAAMPLEPAPTMATVRELDMGCPPFSPAQWFLGASVYTGHHGVGQTGIRPRDTSNWALESVRLAHIRGSVLA